MRIIALRHVIPGTLAAALAALAAAPAGAEVFHSRESALRLAFPGADRVEPVDVILTREQEAAAGDLAGARLPSRLVTAYAGFDGDRPLGWAFLDTHDIRTLPETVMLVVGPDGRLAQARLLAFHEPPEYRPGDAWFSRLSGAALDDDLRIGRGVDGISGATMSAQAVTAAARRALAVWRVAFADRPPTISLP
jgi:hypothetical protein